jgi:hypothetical protein
MASMWGNLTLRHVPSGYKFMHDINSGTSQIARLREVDGALARYFAAAQVLAAGLRQVTQGMAVDVSYFPASADDMFLATWVQCGTNWY